MSPVTTTATSPAAPASTDAITKKLAAAKGTRSSSTRSKSSASEGESSAPESERSLVSNASSAGGVEEPTEQYFLWGCELSRCKDTQVLHYPEDADEDAEHHLLAFKSATLGLDARENERNVVEIQCLDREGRQQRLTLTSLVLGTLDSVKLDLTMTWTRGRDITLKLVKGSGPVSFLGNHVIEIHEEQRDEEFVPDEESSAEDTGMETEGDEMDANEVKDITKEAAEVGEAKKKRTAKK